MNTKSSIMSKTERELRDDIIHQLDLENISIIKNLAITPNRIKLIRELS